MLVVRAVTIAVLAMGLSVSCAGQSSGQQDVPRWRSRGIERLYDGQEPSSVTDLSVSRELRLGSHHDLFTTDCLYEMHRLFEDDSPSAGRIMRKVLLALPLLERDNGLELAVRPQYEIIMALGERITIRAYKRGTRVLPKQGAIAIDTHVHTCASPDSLASPSEMLISAANHGLAGVAITDHDCFEGALRAVEVAKKLKLQGRLPAEFFVIPGEEISSSDGHIIALFLKSEIPPGKSAEWTVQAIHDQGGLAVAAHPLLPHSLHDLAKTLPFDAMETESAAEKLHFAITRSEDQKGRAAFYATVTKPRLGASDTHDPESVAECYTLARCSATPEALREAILTGNVSPVAAVSDVDERAIAEGSFPRILSAYRLLTDLSPLVRKYIHSDSITLSILPRPAIRFSKKF